jgi:hypothetical protein
MTVRVPRLPFSLDPLMAEAKRRARLRRLLVALAAVVVVAAGAVLTVELRGRGAAVAPVPANLTLLVVSGGFPGHGTLPQGDGGRALFHLKCDPASGNVADPTKACAAIAAQPSLVTNPKPYIPGSPATERPGFAVPVPVGGPLLQVCHWHPAKLCPANGPTTSRSPAA